VNIAGYPRISESEIQQSFKCAVSEQTLYALSGFARHTYGDLTHRFQAQDQASPSPTKPYNGAPVPSESPYFEHLEVQYYVLQNTNSGSNLFAKPTTVAYGFVWLLPGARDCSAHHCKRTGKLKLRDVPRSSAVRRLWFTLHLLFVHE
jgi:hypothetical protein